MIGLMLTLLEQDLGTKAIVKAYPQEQWKLSLQTICISNWYI